MNVVKPENMQAFDIHAMTIATGNFATVFWRSIAHKASAYKQLIWVCAALVLALCPLPSRAEDADLAAEAPLVRTLLNEAATLESSMDNADKIRRAAALYCKASRFGSIEAQYRLGMLYFEGRGVAKNLDFASVLFSQAAQQGHYHALIMLDETVKLRTLKLPSCLV